MRSHLAVIVIALLAQLICGCEPDNRGVRPLQQETMIVPQSSVGNPYVLGNSGYVMVPLVLHGARMESKYDASMYILSTPTAGQMISPQGTTFSITQVSDFYEQAANVNWHNVVFYNRATGESHLLLNFKACICVAYLPRVPRVQNPGPVPKHLLFAIADEDTNGDGYLTSTDAVGLYLCDVSGQGLTRLTPRGTQLADVETNGDEDLYVRVLKKPESRPYFGQDDQSIVLHVDLHHPAEGTPIFDQKIIQKAASVEGGK